MAWVAWVVTEIPDPEVERGPGGVPLHAVEARLRRRTQTILREQIA